MTYGQFGVEDQEFDLQCKTTPTPLGGVVGEVVVYPLRLEA
jgi:hypothetical protein